MSESEIRTELQRLLGPADVDRIMDMVNDYAREQASEATYDAIRDYEERM